MNDIATTMRALCAADGAHQYINRWATDTMHVHLHRHGRDWGMELSDETPIAADAAHEWARAFGAPDGTPVLTTCGGRIAVAQWEDLAYDPAPPIAAAYAVAR